MKILYFGGSGERSLNCLKRLVEDGRNIIGVILRDYKKEIRDLEPIKKYMGKKSIELLNDNFKEQGNLEKIASNSPDLIVMVSFDLLVPDKIVLLPKIGIINCHGGKVPEYRGSSPRRWALRNGEKHGGCSVLKVNINEIVDGGEILGQKLYPIDDNDTIEDILRKDAETFPEILSEVLSKVNATRVLEGKKQGPGTYWHKSGIEERKIRFREMPSEEVRNLVRSETRPYLGAWTTYEGKELKIFKVDRTTDQDYAGTPGRIIKFSGADPTVVCKNGSLFVRDIEIDGKKENPKSLKNGSYLGLEK